MLQARRSRVRLTISPAPRLGFTQPLIEYQKMSGNKARPPYKAENLITIYKSIV
jgi:hypothetical protein